MFTNRHFRSMSFAFLITTLSAIAWVAQFRWEGPVNAKGAGLLGAPRSVTAAPLTRETQDTGDLLVLRFDNSLNGENGETPTTATGTSFQTGVQNQGVLLPNPNQLFYASTNNINATEGTFECWLKPTWNGNDAQHYFILQYGGSGGIVIGKDGANNMRIILNRFGVAPGGEVGIAYNVSSWVANQWHHIAFTWSNSNKQLAVYIDGTLRGQSSFTANLPAISSTTLQVGGDGAGSYISAVVDNLRISNVARTAQEISTRLLEGVTVSSWTLNPATTTIEMYPGWAYWVPLNINATTNIGALSLPLLAANWTSSNAAAGIVDVAGQIKSLASGSTTLTGSLGSQQRSINLNVLAPLLGPSEEFVEPFMATPAIGHLYRVPVVIIRYLPTRDGVNMDAATSGVSTPLATMKANLAQIERRHKFMLEEGSKFRGYSSATALPSLGYQVVRTITVYEEIPPGFATGTAGFYFPDYNQILNRFGAETMVNNFGVKEFWIVHQHFGRIAPNESNMSSPTTGDISNSFRTNGDQPVFNRTYVTYGLNFTRSHAEATHNHGHQLESILSYVNQQRDGNTNLWWGQFARAANNPPARCGNTHFPPNALSDYDYTNMTLVASDILNWVPAGGPTTMVNANTWGNAPYAWPGGTAPPQEIESKWYIFWFQSMAGRDTAIPYNTGKLTNWWAFTGDWDAAIQSGMGLHEPGNCNYMLSATSQTVANGGGTASVTVTCPGGCNWFASSNETWITISNGRLGSGNGTVELSVAANTSSPTRTGTVAVAGQLFTITQTGNCPTITVNPANSTFPAAATGQAFNQIFTATGGTGAYTFSVVAGALPTGFSFNPFTGEVSGTIGALGTYNFTIRATDENGCFGERAYTLPVTSTCPSITVNSNPGSLPNGTVGTPYSATFSATGGTGPYTFSVLVGNLPLGLALNATTGALTGTPNGGGSYGFTIRATDANGCTGARVYAIVISGACGYALTPTSINVPVEGTGDFVNITTASSCAWTATSNNSWITIVDGAAGTGVGLLAYFVDANPGPPRTGTMTIAGQLFTVTQSGDCPAISVNPTTPTLSAGTIGTSYSQTFAQTGGNGAVAFTVSAGALPTGLTLNSSTGVLSGTPTNANTFNFTIRATDVNNCTGERAYSITINPALPSCPVVSGMAPANGAVGSSVVIAGTNFTGVTSVKFSNNITAAFVINSATQITATVPAGAATGAITISKTGCTDVQTAVFTVAVNCVTASISDMLTGGTGSSLIVPVLVGDLTGRGVVAYDFTVMFDPAVVTLQTPVFDSAGTLSGGMTITPNTGTPGKLTISAFGVSTISGSGILLNLKFNIVGAAGACGDLTWIGFQFNEGLPCAATSNGRVCVSNSIAGTVGYCVASAKKVPGVVVAASSSQSSTTDGVGFYILNEMSGGAVTVSPTKSGDVNGISSFDASLAAQRAAGIISFTSCQESAADASNNGVVSSFDASLIAQYAAGINNAESRAGTWKFLPSNRSYPSVTGNLTGENYDAVLVGEISGNWAAPGNGPSPAEVQVPVSLPNTTGLSGSSVTIPILVGNLTGQGFMSYDFDLVFDQNVLQLQNPSFDTAGTLSSGLTITPNSLPGRLRVSAFGISPLAGAGTLLELKFLVVGAAGMTTALNWQSFTFNEKIQTGLTNGSVAICAAIGITPDNLPPSTQGLPYNQTLTADGGTAPYNFSLSAGMLPGNMNLSSAGVLSGTPATAGAFNFTLRATDANGCFGERQYTVIVSGNGLQFYPLPAPVRLLDTRAGEIACSQPNAPIQGQTSRTQPGRSLCTIPVNAVALTGNVTTVQSGGGYLTLYPSDAQQPTVASTNYGVNEVVNNVFTVGLGADGAFKIFAFFTTDVVVDVTGYYAPPNTGGLYFHPLPVPVRLLDTRAGEQACVTPGAPLVGNADATQQASSACTGIPAAARTIVGNVTTVGPQTSGYLTLFPGDAQRPLAASSNFNAGQVVNGPFTVGLAPSGEFKIFTFATTHLVVDVLGYYSSEAVDVNGAGLLFNPLPKPVRLLETRASQMVGCYLPGAPLISGVENTQPARGTCEGVTIPANALGVVGNATVVTPNAAGYLTLWPSTAQRPLVATANYNAGAVVNRHFIVGLGGADGAFKIYSFATTHLVVDVSGYFVP
jgi:hypothetical protein